MALRDITNNIDSRIVKKVNLHVRVLNEYAPIKNERLTAQEKEARRQQCRTNVDLWVDGYLYPKDSLLHCCPPFTGIPSFI